LKKPNALKTLLSYLVEIPVVSTSSPYNKELNVVLHHGRYKLLTNGAIYSFGDLYSNFRKSFERFDWENHSIKSCLILGLGLGSIPDMLTTRFKKQIHFTAVEIDEVVTRLAYDYVLNPKQIRVEIFTADAASFLEWHRGKYDMICADVFVGDAIPKSLQTLAALQQMNDLLKPGGILLYNRLSRYKPDIDQSIKFRDEVFLHVFPDGGFIDVDGNWMFVSRMSAFNKKDSSRS
jgi:SAM-dependent methyltransferase